MPPKPPTVKSTRFDTSINRDIPVSRIVPESVSRSPQEFESGVSQASKFVSNLIDQNRQKHVKEIQSSTKESLQPEIAAINTAKFETFQGRDLSDVEDDTLNASLLQQLGIDDVNHPTIVEAKKFFRKLGDAQATGKPLARHTQVLAQAELKKLVSANPLFEDEIRAAAVEGLGFDPTGSDVKEAFDIFNAKEAEKKKPKTLTPFEKDVANFKSAGFNDEQSEAAAFENLRNQVEEDRFNAMVRRGKASGMEFLAQGNRVLGQKISEGMLLLEAMKSSGDISDAEMKVELQKNFALGRQRLVMSVQGSDSDSVKQMLTRYDESTELMMQLWDDSSKRGLYSLENEFLVESASRDVNLIPGILEGQKLFGDKFTDVFLSWSSTADNENARRVLLRMDPNARGVANFANMFQPIKRSLEMLDGKQAPTTVEEKEGMAFSVGAIFSGKHSDDATLAEVANNASSTMGMAETLRLFDNNAVKSNALRNPKFAKELQNIYAVERKDATDQAKEALEALKAFPRTSGENEIRLFANNEGRFEIVGDLPKPRSSQERLSPVIQESLKLREAIARLNSIVSITNTYNGQVLPIDISVDDTIVREIHKDYAEWLESNSK